MAYNAISIKQMVSDITQQKFFLPAIQRKFVWTEEKICNLFDSIVRDYPIGTFLFWDLTPEIANQYTFYKFLNKYDERDPFNDLVHHDFNQSIWGVLDGQQRISSMYIALQGVYQTKRKYARADSGNAYPIREFYLNLIGKRDDYEFCFLEPSQALERTKTQYYFRVREVLSCKSGTLGPDVVEDLIKRDKAHGALLVQYERNAARKISVLLKKFNEDKLINYFKVDGKDLEEVLEIFVRVNSGGAVLSKSDLLFSTIVAHWRKGRDEIERLIKDLNGDDNLFDFNSDFLMRTFLFMNDLAVGLKVTHFNKETVRRIKLNWDATRSALLGAVKLLREFGFTATRLSSNYAVTPIAYYILKGGSLDDVSKQGWRLFVIQSLLLQVYSGQADTALTGIREGLRMRSEDGSKTYVLKSKTFDFNRFQDTALSGGKRLRIHDQDIDEMLEYKKGSMAFLVLSILYPSLSTNKLSFHQDHMHPYSSFTEAQLKAQGVDTDLLKTWQDKRDCIANLQLLEGMENNDKRAKPLIDWVEQEFPEPDQDREYRQRNFIPEHQSLAFTDFDAFFEARKALLKRKLTQVFGLDA